jgi:hypothetical protein
MFWVVVFGVIALGGLAMVICFGISLWRKSQALLAEVGVLLERADELAGLLDRLEVAAGTAAQPRFPRGSDDVGLENDHRDLGLTRQQAT